MIDNDARGVIGRLQAWADQRAEVRAMLLTSTRAIPNGQVDALSDYDVILVVADISPFYEDRAWLEHFGQVLVTYWDPIQPEADYGCKVFANVIQYESGLRIDFTLWPTELLRRIAGSGILPAELDAGYVVLLDKDRVASGLKPPTYKAYRPVRPSEGVYQTLVAEFFSDAPYVAKCLWRGELMPAKWALDYDMKHVYLRRMLEWRVALEHDWSITTGALGKGLKKQLPPELWTQLEGTYAGAGIADNWEALFRTIEVFRRVAGEVAGQLGYAYPADLERRVKELLEKIRDLSSRPHDLHAG